jgi:hypothetical protein
MLKSKWENLAAAARRNMRAVVVCACVLALGVLSLGLKLAHNQATAAALVSYDALREARHDKSLTRGEFRQALVTLVRRKPEAIAEMQGRDIRMVFGNPQQVRRDRGVHVWQYRTDQCVIDVYMREERGTEARLKAVHHALRKRRLIKVNAGSDTSAGKNGLTARQRSQCLRAAFRNHDPGQGGQSYASLE